MGMREILKAVYLLLILNVGLVVNFILRLHAEPEYQIAITSQRDALLLFGQNDYGTISVRIFKNWSELNAYLDSRQLKLPNITYTQAGSASEVLLKKSVGANPYYRIFWRTQGAEKAAAVNWSQNVAARELLPVIHAPDSETAIKFHDYILYTQFMRHSGFGFALPVVDASSI